LAGVSVGIAAAILIEWTAMTTDSLREALLPRPFQPFAIQMADGRAFHVPHSEFVFAPKGARTIVLHVGRDRYHMIDALLISSLDFVDGRRASGNGKKRGR